MKGIITTIEEIKGLKDGDVRPGDIIPFTIIEKRKDYLGRRNQVQCYARIILLKETKNK